MKLPWKPFLTTPQSTAPSSYYSSYVLSYVPFHLSIQQITKDRIWPFLVVQRPIVTNGNGKMVLWMRGIKSRYEGLFQRKCSQFCLKRSCSTWSLRRRGQILSENFYFVGIFRMDVLWRNRRSIATNVEKHGALLVTSRSFRSLEKNTHC